MTSIRIPFQFDGGRLAVTKSPDIAAQQKIIDVLTTGKFERVMRHNYGTGLQSLLFDVLDELEFSDFKVDAIQTLNQTVSRVEVLDLVVAPADNYAFYGESPTTLTVSVVYRLPLGAPQVVKFSVAVPGAIHEDTPI